MGEMNESGYRILKTQLFNEQLRAIALYIAENAQDAQPALKLLDEIEQCIEAMRYFPGRGARPHDRRLRALEYRFVTVGSYIVFYSYSDESHTVTVLAIMHSKQHYANVL